MSFILRNWIRQRSDEDNCRATIANLLLLLRMRVSQTTIRHSVMSHPEFPSLTAIVDSLGDLGIETEPVMCTPEHLSDLTLPSILHLKRGHFIVLQSVSEQGVTYIDPRSGWITKRLRQFIDEWSGAALVVTKIKQYEEVGYKQKNLISRLTSVQPLMSGLGLFVLLLLVVGAHIKELSFHHELVYLLMTKVIGLLLSGILVFQEYHRESSFLSRLCPPTGRVNCRNVLKSPAGKILGLMPVSEIGLIYFSGGVLSIALALLAGQPGIAIVFLALMSVFPLPYSVYLIVYQAFRLHHWCLLCIGVHCVVAAEFLILFDNVSGFFTVPVDVRGILPVALGLSFSFFLWTGIRTAMRNSPLFDRAFYEALRMRNNPIVIKALLAGQEEIKISKFTTEIEIGSKLAPNQILVVVNPLCAPCHDSVSAIAQLVDQYPGQINGMIRFLHGSDSRDGTDVLEHLIALALAGQMKEAFEALDDWLHKIDFTKMSEWKHRFPIASQVDREAIPLVIRQHADWVRSVGIRGTPALFLNGRRLPAAFKIQQLRYILEDEVMTYVA